MSDVFTVQMRVGYPKDQLQIATVEPRASCLRCKSNVAVMCTGQLRKHKNLATARWCLADRAPVQMS